MNHYTEQALLISPVCSQIFQLKIKIENQYRLRSLIQKESEFEYLNLLMPLSRLLSSLFHPYKMAVTFLLKYCQFIKILYFS
jgi:hypothetical protein